MTRSMPTTAAPHPARLTSRSDRNSGCRTRQDGHAEQEQFIVSENAALSPDGQRPLHSIYRPHDRHGGAIDTYHVLANANRLGATAAMRLRMGTSTGRYPRCTARAVASAGRVARTMLPSCRNSAGARCPMRVPTARHTVARVVDHAQWHRRQGSQAQRGQAESHPCEEDVALHCRTLR